MSDPRLMHRPLAISSVLSGGVEKTITPTDDERVAIASALGLLDLPSLSAKVVATRAGDVLHLNGRLNAEVVQSCVVTLVPVRQSIDEPIARQFVRDDGRRPDAQELGDVLIPDEDVPDLYTGEAIDLGEVVFEALSLALDPYPRAPGVEFDLSDDADSDDKTSPFAVLKSLGQRGSS